MARLVELCSLRVIDCVWLHPCPIPRNQCKSHVHAPHQKPESTTLSLGARHLVRAQPVVRPQVLFTGGIIKGFVSYSLSCMQETRLAHLSQRWVGDVHGPECGTGLRKVRPASHD